MKKYFTSMNRKIVMFMVLGFAFVFTTTTAFAALTLNSTTVSSDGALTLTGTASSIWDLGASNTLSLQTTNNGAITTGSGLFTLGGSLVASIIRPLSDSTTAIKINKADGTTNILNIDTTNSRIGIGTTTPSLVLHVVGSENQFRLDNGSGATLDIKNSLNTIWDFVPTTVNGTDSAIVRFFRATNTSGVTSIDLTAGNNTSGVKVRVSGNGDSWFNPTTGGVGIGTISPNANAILDVTSTTKAFMPPRMTTTQRDAIASPTAGMVIYNSTTNKLNVYTTAWEAITSS